MVALRKLSAAAVTLVVLTIPLSAHAVSYGSGSYGNGVYGTTLPLQSSGSVIDPRAADTGETGTDDPVAEDSDSPSDDQGVATTSPSAETAPSFDVPQLNLEGADTATLERYLPLLKQLLALMQKLAAMSQ